MDFITFDGVTIPFLTLNEVKYSKYGKKEIKSMLKEYSITLHDSDKSFSKRVIDTLDYYWKREKETEQSKVYHFINRVRN